MRVVAAARGGVVSAAAARAVGADSSAVRRLCGSGEWFRIRRGVYGDALFRSGARLLGLPLPPIVDARVSITRRPPAPDTGPRTASGIGVALHISDDDDRDIRHVSGVPVLAGARLVVDCCAVVPPESALAIADKALFRQITTRPQLNEELERCREQSGGAGPFRCGSIPQAQVDMWFPEHRTVGEADGAGKYDAPGSLFKKKQRGAGRRWLPASSAFERRQAG